VRRLVTDVTGGRGPHLTRRLRWLGVAVVLAAVALVAVNGRVRDSFDSPYPVRATLRFDPVLSSLLSADAISWESFPEVPMHYSFRSGETLASVLSDLGLSSQQSHRAAEAAAELTDLRRLRAGDGYAAFYNGEELAEVHLAIRDEGRLELSRSTDEQWEAGFRAYDRTTELRSVRGVLAGSLEGSIRRVGGDGEAAYRMADVLQWDMDFNRDLREGDRFEVLYERVYLDGEFHDLGSVLALAYESGSRRLTAYRFGEANAYYDAEGRPLQKMFLRSPMRYSRVTSNFSSRRFHPVLKTYRPHYGVDYGAPSGTPVRATASGVVASAAWDDGGGRMVRIRHPNNYLTAYLHLSGYADGIRSGARVSQGQVIGYVGSSGLATGAHLDYRVQLGGKWINPLALPNEPAPPIAESELPRFFAWKAELDAGLQADVPRLEMLAASSAEPMDEAVVR
jgi:murein DD-endopeptidase MepM/ murein hydrolase activator NlpD